jgi:hypothetical protein
MRSADAAFDCLRGQGGPGSRIVNITYQHGMVGPGHFAYAVSRGGSCS